MFCYLCGFMRMKHYSQPDTSNLDYKPRHKKRKQFTIDYSFQQSQLTSGC